MEVSCDCLHVLRHVAYPFLALAFEAPRLSRPVADLLPPPLFDAVGAEVLHELYELGSALPLPGLGVLGVLRS